ncbi:cuticlin-1-like [Uloborus diversus]|uniref:cuticlin-1-like n=1 Tax=Uloborus diversus TaxID=327109 RepID=UPI00240A2E21|nr:cuticlin-1-like [Uloborus diversus]
MIDLVVFGKTTFSFVAASALVSGVAIACHSHSIMVNISTNSHFNGMIYPKGLSKNSTCMQEYNDQGPFITYTLPLRSCNTMSTDLEDGIEYFNSVIIQPHRKLVTSQGRVYQVKCKYETREQTLFSNFNVSMMGTTPILATAPMPACSMKIYYGNPEERQVAESVKIGDRLSLVISIDYQDVYGIKVTNCIVRDGLNWGEQPLINNEGCPVDEEIMGPFEYTLNNTEAIVAFQAHKFPYTASVYYQCNVKLCLKHGGDCGDVPPICDITGHNLQRRRRSVNDLEEEGSLRALLEEDVFIKDRSIEVYSGLYVSEEEEQQTNDDPEESDHSKSSPLTDSDLICISTEKFIAGLGIACCIVTLAVASLVYIVIRKRRRRKSASSASSIYSGTANPYNIYARD